MRWVLKLLPTFCFVLAGVLCGLLIVCHKQVNLPAVESLYTDLSFRVARPLSRHTLFITERTAPKSEELQRNSGLLEHAVTPQDKEELQEFFKASQSPPDTAVADGTGKVQELESEVAAMAKEIRVNALYNKIEQDPKSAKVVWHQLEELDASYEDFEHPVSISMLANAQAIDDVDVLL